MDHNSDWIGDLACGWLIFQGFLSSMVLFALRDYKSAIGFLIGTIAICIAVIVADRYAN